MKKKRFLLFLSVGLVVVAGLFLAGNAISTYALDENDCLSCHGESGVNPVPVDHAGRSNDTCTGCHSEA